jgi:hypothetical protein
MAAQHFQTWNAPPDYNTVFFVHKIGEFWYNARAVRCRYWAPQFFRTDICNFT